MFRTAEPAAGPSFETTTRIIWSPGDNLIWPASSIEPPEDRVRTETLKSGEVLPVVASAGMIGTITWTRSKSSIENATLRLDIGHTSSKCMNLDRLTLASPDC